MKLIHIIDDRQYVRTNCFQHMLLRNLRSQDIDYEDVTIIDINNGFKIPDGDIILSTLKLRTLYKNLDVLKRSLDGREVFIYDQDPWESFVDTASYKGAYYAIVNHINVKSFINTSKWWSDFLKSKGFKSIFARQWSLRDYCDIGPNWLDRPIQLGFKGSLHKHRKKAFDQLENLGLRSTILPSGGYDEFLRDLHKMQFFLHEQSGEKWSIDGIPLPLGLKYVNWAKEIEIVSRGTIALRMYEPGLESYYVDKIPAVITYNELRDVPHIIENSLIYHKETKEKIEHSIEFVKSIEGWFNLRELNV